MSETKQLREFFIYSGTDGMWKLALEEKYVWVNTPEKLKVREVSAEYDAAVEYMKAVLEDYAKLKLFGATARMALEAFDAAAKVGK